MLTPAARFELARREAAALSFGASASMHLDCVAGVSGNVLQLLYVAQCAACYACAMLRPLAELAQWRDARATEEVLMLLVQLSFLGLVLPLRPLLVLLALALSLHRTRLFRTVLSTQTSLVRKVWRGREHRRLVQFPPSNVALTILAQQQAVLAAQSTQQKK
jgi:hypothetical protein